MRTPAALAVAAALALGGCGGSDPPPDQDQVRSAVADYVAAVGGDDPERVCELIVAQDGKRPPERCADRIQRAQMQPLGRVRVRTVRVRGSSAVAALAGGERVRLRRVDGAWRIVAPG